MICSVYFLCSKYSILTYLANCTHRIFRFEKIPDELEPVRLSSKKIRNLGFQFKYSFEDMYTHAIDACKEKGFLPKTAEIPVNWHGQ